MKARRWRLGFTGVLAASLAVALLWFLYQKTQDSGQEARAAVEEQLRRVHQLDSDWNVEIMSSKIGLNTSYDPIVGPSKAVGAALDRVEAMEGADDASVAPRLKAMRGLFAQKAGLVDDFKSHNSVLRNSLRFLPTAANDAQAALAAEPDGKVAALLRPQVAGLLDEALKYAVVTDEAQRIQLDAVATRLEEASQSLPESSPARASVGTLVNHARIVHRWVGDEASLLAGIVQVPTVAAIDASTAAFNAWFLERSGEIEIWRKALFAYSALLLVLAGFTAMRLRESYRQINIMNAALVSANDGLEHRVEERTRELADAMASLRESEVQLIQSEKMSSLGQMVAGIAHEINTPLAYVRSSLETIGDQLSEVGDLVRHSGSLLRAMAAPEADAELLSQSFSALSALTQSLAANGVTEELHHLAADSLHGLDQIGEIVVSLRNFSRLDRSKTTLFDLREGLDSTLVIARAAIGEHRVVKAYGDIPDVLCAPSQLNQVFLNLITNAAQAMPGPGPGTITLRTGLDEGMVRVDVTDSGSGIAPEHLSRIFDPFFTTKEIGKGTGLGLSIAYKIVQEHAGRISVRSVPGEGTTFSIHLPCTAPALTDTGVTS
jgi:two-component system, NtrC family, sensor kinase